MLLFLGHRSVNISFKEKEFIRLLLWFLMRGFDSKDCGNKHQGTCFWIILISLEVNLGWRRTGLDVKCHLRNKLTEVAMAVQESKWPHWKKSSFHGHLCWMLICRHEDCAIIPIISSSSCSLPADAIERGFHVSPPCCEIPVDYLTCWWHTSACSMDASCGFHFKLQFKLQSLPPE